MPIYEYLCKNCGRHFEKRQTISEATLTMCEECGGQLEKQWSLSGFAFKGEGWYVTDYASKKGGADTKEGSTAADAKEKTSTSESTASADSASKPKSEKPAKD